MSGGWLKAGGIAGAVVLATATATGIALHVFENEGGQGVHDTLANSVSKGSASAVLSEGAPSAPVATSPFSFSGISPEPKSESFTQTSQPSGPNVPRYTGTQPQGAISVSGGSSASPVSTIVSVPVHAQGLSSSGVAAPAVAHTGAFVLTSASAPGALSAGSAAPRTGADTSRGPLVVGLQSSGQGAAQQSASSGPVAVDSTVPGNSVSAGGKTVAVESVDHTSDNAVVLAVRGTAPPAKTPSVGRPLTYEQQLFRTLWGWGASEEAGRLAAGLPSR